MKEFIEKLIGRLEEISYNHFDLKLSDAKEIVNQLAEEYKDKDCSECSRRKWYQIGYADAEKKLADECNNNFCEWKWGIDSAQVQCQGDRILFGSRRLFSYCPYCGKKIKVVE